MTIEAKTKKFTIELALEDRNIELILNPVGKKTYKAIIEAYQTLQNTELQKIQTMADTEKDSVSKALDVMNLMVKEADASLNALKHILDASEWAKIAEIADLLPIDTVNKMLVAIAENMNETFVESLMEGKI